MKKVLEDNVSKMAKNINNINSHLDSNAEIYRRQLLSANSLIATLQSNIRSIESEKYAAYKRINELNEQLNEARRTIEQLGPEGLSATE
jgi:chromosome segregation ATPase|tara:strand:+ start:1952 stop:2218 length:267 start_codon:yes stop_codon:yes gene_type:complete